MHADLSISLPLLYGFALTLARIAGIFVFLPFPGTHAGPAVARIVLALVCTMSLSSRWPASNSMPGAGTSAMHLASEAVLGVLVGLAVGFIADGFLLGAQALSMPAGYAYASTFDPNTSADSGILIILAQLIAAVLFFTTGLDRQLILAMANSLDAIPPGTFLARPAMADEVMKLGSSMFILALRLAMPIVAMLLVVDLALGILGRLNPHIQIVNMAFPAKMLVSLILLAATLSVFPYLFREQSARTMNTVTRFINRR